MKPTLALLLLTVASVALTATAAPPNIIFIMADDMGPGDVSAINPKSAWKTPHIDRLAREGMIFTDAHSGSAVCTPTRYGVLTGRYAWRTRLKSGVLFGYDDALIKPGRATVASILKEKGYRTACIGKWHLGLNWERTSAKKEDLDYSKPFQGGPIDLGFDYFFGIPASLDMAPYVYLVNEGVEAAPDHNVKAMRGKKMWRAGPAAPGFKHEDVLPRLGKQAAAFIEKNHDKPFFIYLPLAAPHTPIVPTRKFQGISKVTDYGDFCIEVDDCVGQVLSALDRLDIADNTLVIFTADNGCSPMADFNELRGFNHDPSHGLRGHKADIFEGGHRVPFVARWPGVTPAGTKSDEIICLTDLLATSAAMAGAKLPDNAGEDSYNIVPALKGKSGKPIREATVHHSINGSFAIRQGKWKLSFCPGSGGWSNPRPAKAGDLPRFQLYDLESDRAEKNNLAADHPEVIQRLGFLMKRYIERGRSTQGKPQANTETGNWKQTSWMKDF